MAICGWTVTQCGCGKCWDTYTNTVQTGAEHLAAMVMWAATGRQYGRCEIVVRPCAREALDPQYRTYPVDWSTLGGGSGPYTLGGVWYNGPVGCEESCDCSAGTRELVLDGPTTTASITSVTLSGILLAPAAYRVLDGRRLIRIDGSAWPTCDDPSADPAPIEVTYLIGLPVPPAVQVAFERLACEFARACSGAPCALPQQLRSLTRQGVELQVEQLPIDTTGPLLTGIREVDLVIRAVNPRGRQARSMVISPDLPAPARVV